MKIFGNNYFAIKSYVVAPHQNYLIIKKQFYLVVITCIYEEDTELSLSFNSGGTLRINRRFFFLILKKKHMW